MGGNQQITNCPSSLNPSVNPSVWPLKNTLIKNVGLLTG